MELKKYKHGILSLDGRVRSELDRNPVVAVHPYFISEKNEEYDPDYVRRINKFFRTLQRPLVVLEEFDKINKTSDKLNSLGRSSNTFFVETKYRHPDPYTIEWEDFFRFMRKEFSPESISLCGGYFRMGPTPIDSGCLGYTAHKLSEDDFKIDILDKKGLTFDWR